MSDAPATALPKPCLCPLCGALLEASSPMDGDASPAPGDTSMCAMCGVVLIYTPDLMVRAATREDFAAMDVRLLKMLVALQFAQRAARQLFPPKPVVKN